MKSLALHDGTLFPALGLGTWLSKPDTVRLAVRKAIEVGYRHIDCAWIYQNEAEVGQGIAEAIAAGDVTREQLWVTTKLWNDAHARPQVKPALQASLALLGLDYVDLYLVHWPVALRAGAKFAKTAEDYVPLTEAPLAATWEAMVALQSIGLTRQVGVSNFSAAQIGSISDAVGVVPAVNQVELHPYLQQPALLAAMTERGIVTTAYAPLGSSGRPAGMRRDDEVSLLDNQAIVAIASAHDASPAQVLIAWALARDTAVIPKSTTPSRIAENFAAAELTLTADERMTLEGLDAAARYVDGSFWCGPGSPHTLQSLWG